MTTLRMSLFGIRGTRLWASGSLALLAVLLVWSLAQAFFPRFVAGPETERFWFLSIVALAGVALSLVAHECVHVLVDRHYGIAPNGITVLGFGGVGDEREGSEWFRATVAGALWGPVTSLGLSFLFFGACVVVESMGLSRDLSATAFFLSLFNFLLAVINVIPAFPLDAGKALRAFLWRRTHDPIAATRSAMRVGYAVVLGLAAAGAAVAIAGHPVVGAWIFLLGAALRAAGDSAARDVVVRAFAKGRPAALVAREHHVGVPPYVLIAPVWGRFDDRLRTRLLPVVEDGKLMGCVTPHEFRWLDRLAWENATVGELAIPVSSDNTVGAETDLADVIAQLERTGLPAVMVADAHGRLLGTICYEDIVDYVMAELNASSPLRRVA